MLSFLDRLLRERCLWHAEPLFDRDAVGTAVFRCPRCMKTWPILPEQQTRHEVVARQPFDSARVLSRPRLVRANGARSFASSF
jgi:hypothetical protein